MFFRQFFCSGSGTAKDMQRVSAILEKKPANHLCRMPKASKRPENQSLHAYYRNNIIHNTNASGGDENGTMVRVGLTSLILLAGVRTDMICEKIDNRLIVFGLLSGIGFHICVLRTNSWADVILAMVLPIMICWVLFRIRALGAGDIKLFCVVGCLNGTEVVVNTMIGAILIAAGYAFFYLVKSRQFFAAFSDLFYYAERTIAQKRLRSYRTYASAVRKMHFSPAVLLGYFSTLMGVSIWAFTG